MTPSTPTKLPFHLVAIFALGQMGWSIASFSVANLLTYFYYSPENSKGIGIFPSFIPQGAVFFSLTILGLLTFSTRLFDAFKDPFIAFLSDQNKSKIGRRKFFMLLGATPLAALSFLVFLPPDSGITNLNIVWLGMTLFAFYVSFSLYVTPFNALIAEYGHNSEERLNISTWISVTWALGFAIGNQIYSLQSWAQESFSFTSTQSFQYVLISFSIAAWIFMLLPVIFINEKKYATFTPSSEKLFSSLNATWADKSFRLFLFSDLFYWISLTFIQLGMSYYILVLLNLPADFLSKLMLIMFAFSFVFYAPINFLAKKIGKKTPLIIAFLIFAVVFLLISQLGNLPFSPIAQAYAIVVLAALPIAIFGILPNAIIADFSDASASSTGLSRTAMYYGTRTLSMKLGISLANLIFPSLLLYGKGVGNDLGIRLTSYFAIVFSLFGCLCYIGIKNNNVKLSGHQ